MAKRIRTLELHYPIQFLINIYLSNRKRFPCLHSLIKTREGLGEFETVMQTRDDVENSLKASSVYIRLSKHRKKVFYCFYKIIFPRKKRKTLGMALIKREVLTSRKNLVHEVLHA